MEPKKKNIEKVLEDVRSALKNYDVKFIDVLVDQTTQKERERFARYRIPITKYIERMPKKKQFVLRLSPKKRPATPKKVKLSPKKKPKKNWLLALDQQIDLLIEKVSIRKTARIMRIIMFDSSCLAKEQSLFAERYHGSQTSSILTTGKLD